jgi:hypothetical protein
MTLLIKLSLKGNNTLIYYFEKWENRITPTLFFLARSARGSR